MRKCTCVLATLLVLTCGVTVFGGPDAGRATVSPTLTPQLIPEGRIFKAETDTPAQRIVDDATRARGGVAAGTEYMAYAFKGDYDTGYGLFLNYVPNSGLYYPGVFTADDFMMGAGFDPAVNTITAYELLVYRSSIDPLDGITLARYDFELWDGDPFLSIHTAGYTNAVIPGTHCTWTGVPGPIVAWLYCELPAKVMIPNAWVWGVLSGEDTCRTGWRISGQTPQIGSIIMEGDPPFGIDIFEAHTDYDAQFTGVDAFCCQDSALTACVWGTGAACPGDDSTYPRGFCMDGYAESAWISWYGGPCTGGLSDFCATHVFNAYSWSKFTAGLVPKPKMGATIDGNMITIEKGGQAVAFELLFENWVIPVKTWQAKIDPAGYANGLGGTLTPYNPACTTSADCEALLDVGSACNDPGYPPGGCAPGFQGWKDDMTLALGINAVNIATLYFTYGSTTLVAPADDPGGPRPGGQLWLWVPDTAKGMYHIGFVAVDTWMKDNQNNFIPLIALVPGVVNVEIGQCCDLSGGVGNFVCVADDYTVNECNDIGGVFTVGKICDPLVDDNDECGCVVDGDCDDGDACTDDWCENPPGTCHNDENFDDAVYCCDPADGSTTEIVDIAKDLLPNECTDDTCSLGGDRGIAVHTPVADGTPCQDQELCKTVNDVCTAGVCDGEEITTIPCNDNATCEALTAGLGSCNLAQKLCRCVPPSLNFAIAAGAKPNPKCFEEDDDITVDVFFKDVAEMVVGGQFMVFYDPSCLDFKSITAGAAFPVQLSEIVDEAAGSIFYAVGADPIIGGAMGTQTLAQINFEKLGECAACDLCFGGENPMEPILSNDSGQPVLGLEMYCSNEIMGNDTLSLVVPEDAKVNVDCDANTAMVSWAAPTAGSSCYDVDLQCSGTQPNGAPYAQDVVYGGGEMPIGVSNFYCTATSTVCGDFIDGGWTITVNEQTTLDVTVQLEPVMVGDINRCITFELYADCVGDPMVINTVLPFGGKWDFVGHFTDSFKIPAAGQWVCITAMDKLHSLRAVADLVCSGGIFSATFKGDPDFFGGNWLTQGNLDGWKKTDGENVIDILDFGTFVANYLAQVDPNTVCEIINDAAHADINGDGVVNALDFAFIVRNFMEHSKGACCPDGISGADEGLASVTVRELRAMGRGELAVADINGDGVLDVADMQAFMAGDLDKPTRGNRLGTK